MADRAIPAAVAIAKFFECGIEILQCVQDPYEVPLQQRDLEPVKRRIRRALPGVDLRVSVIVEPHAPAGIAAAAQHQLPVLATGATVFELDRYVGSVAESVVRLSGQPAVIVGPAADTEHAFTVDRVAVPLDGSTLAESAIPLAVEWANELDVPLHLLSVVPQTPTDADGPAPVDVDYLRETAASVEGAIQPVTWHMMSSDNTAAALAEAAEDALLVLHTHGRTGLARIAVGSVATDVIRVARRAVVLARPELAEATGGDGAKHAAGAES
ncbi:MAG: universal stress protein [Acidimicrobiales bacterium]|nr:universal stress protein [Acidimicrobiales bacterium]